MIKVIGKTTDDKLVVEGVYKFYSSIGLPLEMIFDYCRNNNIIPCWISFVREAEEAGMEYKRIISKLDEALIDVYGANFRSVVINQLNFYQNSGKNV